MKKIYYYEEPRAIDKKNGIIEMIGNAHELREVDAVYTENSDLRHLLNIRDDMRSADLEIPIYVITNQYRESILHAVLPVVEVISDQNSSDTIARMIDSDIGRPAVTGNVVFTRKEKMVLEEIGYGLCDKEISVSLAMSERTVRRYKTKLLEKTGLLSSGQLGLYALSNQFVS